MKRWKRIHQADIHQRKARVVLFISDKIVFKAKCIIRNKDSNYIKITGSIHQEEMLILKLHMY